jgi:hypothetical protein
MECFQSVSGKVKHKLSVHRTPKCDDIKYKPYAKESYLIIDICYCLHTKKLMFCIYGDT